MSSWRAPFRGQYALNSFITIPGSKSVTNRALILAALATTHSLFHRPLRSRDTELMAQGLRSMGISIVAEKSENKEATGASSAGQYPQPLFGKPKKVEATESTGTGSSGSYETPAAWAKSTKKKDWRGKSKTQIPGGKFVTIKKKCKKFPYCNQGDIKALKLYENETVKKVIKKISLKVHFIFYFFLS